MWIEELPNGKYKYVERYVDNLTGKQKKVSITHDKRNASVMKEMPLLLAEKIKKKQSKHTTTTLTVQELIEIWITHYATTVRPTTLRVRANSARIIAHALGNILVANLTAVMINKYLLQVYNEGKSQHTVKERMVVIKQVIRHAIIIGIISDTSLLDKIQMPIKYSYEKDDYKHLTDEEVLYIISELERLNYHQEAILVRLQVNTGMRFDEMVALDYKKHIDLKDKTILIERSYDPIKKRFGLTKSGKPRLIHINNDMTQLIKEQILTSQLQTMKRNIPKDNTLLFKTRHGNPYPLQSMNVKLKYVQMNKRITTHIFRHTFITRMIENGMDRYLLAQYVGHSSTKMIDKIYSHFTSKLDNQMREQINLINSL